MDKVETAQAVAGAHTAFYSWKSPNARLRQMERSDLHKQELEALKSKFIMERKREPKNSSKATVTSIVYQLVRQTGI
jgi:hypothetical protein